MSIPLLFPVHRIGQYSLSVKPATAAMHESDQAVQAVHSCNNWCLGPLWSDSMVIKLVSVLFGKFTTLVVTKSWPMETKLPCGDQWKAEKLGAFWRWPITRCFIKSDSAGLFIDHSINFSLNGEYWRAVQSLLDFYDKPQRLRFINMTKLP